EKNIIGVVINSKEIRNYVDIYKSTMNNNYDYLILSIKDVTSHVIKSEIKSSSSNRFNVISNMSPDAILTISSFGYITYVNPAFARLTGFPEEEIIGKHVINVPTLRGRELKPYLDMFKDFLSGKMDFKSLEFPYTRKDGSSGIGNAYVNTINVNGKRELVTIVKDITDKRKKEEEYQNIFKTSPEGIIHLDLEGNIKDINNTGLKLLNIDESKYIGKSVFSIESELYKKDIDIMSIYNKIISNKDVDPFEIQVSVGDSFKCIEIYSSLIKVHEESLGIQLLLRDITQQKEIENERKLYTENLEKMVEERTNQIMDNEKMVTLAKISSMIAHDLKGPLQIINNSIHLIKLKPDDNEQYLEFIENAVKQANDLIEEMRIRSKETPLKIENVNLENIVNESLIHVKISENVNFEKIIKTDKKIGLDKSKFIRVFNNLFKNAIEAMPNGGKIIIVVEEKQGNVSIEVIDTGLGIPEEKLNNLFRPFQSTKAKGMGLGLTFCKNTVESHGGNISVKSEQGKGTTFTILIPINREYETETYIENGIKIKDTLIE
ncbi:PAS domain S-box protein, partial [Thermoproteota archaeon]